MASWNIPALINKISEDVPAIKALLTALFKWTDADTTDVPVGAKRLQDVAGGKQMQEYSGSAWGNVGKLMHDVDMLDGKHASTAQTADTIPVRDANGTIPGNVSGNAATATTAYGLAGDFVVPVANGGTGATTEAGARASLGTDNASNISSGILDIAYGGTGSSTKNFVDLTENQNVGGTKTFSSEIKSTAETFISGAMTGVSVADTSRGQVSKKILCRVDDKDGVRIFGIEPQAATDGTRHIFFNSRNRADSGWIDWFELLELVDGTVQVKTKTPPAAANDTQIATTNWVRTATGNTSLNAATATSAGTCTGNAATATKVVATVANDKTGELVHGTMGTNDAFRIAIGGASNAGWAEIATADDYNEPIYVRQYQGNFATLKRTVTLLDASGNSSFPGTITATFKGNVTGNCSGSSGSCTGNAATATKATQDSAGQQINKTYIKALSVSGKTITYTKGDGTTGTITTQDTNTTYGNMKGATASAAGAAGLVPAPAKGKQGQYLRGDGAWATPTNTTYKNFVKSGSSAAAGLVPKPSTTAGTSKYLREDCSWQVPPNTNTTYGVFGQYYNGLVPAPNDRNRWDWYLAGDGQWRSVQSASTSDRRLKQNFKDVPEDIIDIWGNVRWIQFLLKRDVSEEGEHARPHVGLVVQDLHEVYEKHGIDIKKYGITTHDLREATPAKYDEDGNLISSPQEAVDRWMLNYNDALAFEALYLRKKIRLIEERLARVESKVN